MPVGDGPACDSAQSGTKEHRNHTQSCIPVPRRRATPCPSLRRAQANVVFAAAAAGDSAAAAALCGMFANRSLTFLPDGRRGVLTSGGLAPDWRGAAYAAAVAQPHGCALDLGARAGPRAWGLTLASRVGQSDVAKTVDVVASDRPAKLPFSDFFSVVSGEAGAVMEGLALCPCGTRAAGLLTRLVQAHSCVLE
jgi:hypothetical protein